MASAVVCRCSQLETPTSLADCVAGLDPSAGGIAHHSTVAAGCSSTQHHVVTGICCPPCPQTAVCKGGRAFGLAGFGPLGAQDPRQGMQHAVTRYTEATLWPKPQLVMQCMPGHRVACARLPLLLLSVPRPSQDSPPQSWGSPGRRRGAAAAKQTLHTANPCGIKARLLNSSPGCDCFAPFRAL